MKRRFPMTYCFSFFTREANTIIMQVQFWLCLPDIQLCLAEQVCEQLCLDMHYDLGHVINSGSYDCVPMNHEEGLMDFPPELAVHFEVAVSRDFGHPKLYGTQTPLEGRDPKRGRRIHSGTAYESIIDMFKQQGETQAQDTGCGDDDDEDE